MNDIVLAIITTVIGLVGGGVITVYLTKRKTPSWACKLNLLFNKGVSQIDELKIKYKDYDVDNLSSVYIAFWNNGKETIKDDEIVEKLTISVKEPHKIYFAEVTKASRESNHLMVVHSGENKSAEIVFKYLDYNQGAIIHIFTDCTNLDDIELNGAIMGCKKIKKCVNKKDGFIDEIFPPLLTGVASTLSAEITEKLGVNKVGSTVIMGTVILICFVIIFLINYYSRLKNKIPKDLKKYF